MIALFLCIWMGMANETCSVVDTFDDYSACDEQLEEMIYLPKGVVASCQNMSACTGFGEAE